MGIIWRWKKIKMLDSTVIAYRHLKYEKQFTRIPKTHCNCKITFNSLSSPPQMPGSHRTVWTSLDSESSREAQKVESDHCSPTASAAQCEASMLWAEKLAQSIILNRQTSLLIPLLTAGNGVKTPSHLFTQLLSCSVDVPKQMYKCPMTINWWFILQDAC